MEVLPVPALRVEAEGAEDNKGDEGDNSCQNEFARRAGPELSAEYRYPSASFIQEGNTHHGE